MFNKAVLRSSVLAILCSVVLLGSLAGCARPPAAGPKEETPESIAVPPPAPLPPKAEEVGEPVPPPSMAEAQKCLARVYKDVVTMDETRTPQFLTGDFNGDGYQDIAIIVKPTKAKLAEINSEVAGWIIRDALAVTAPEPRMKLDPHAPPTRPTIGEKDETLLAIIHGYGPKGWRDDGARQTFLTRNAVGKTMSVASKKSILSQKRLGPPLLGDVIQQTMMGGTGYIYYTGAAYAWFDPRTYKGEPEKRKVH